MSVIKLTVNKRVAESLGMSNAASAFGTYDGGTWKTADVDAAIDAADALVASALMMTPGAGQRRAFETASSTAHGALIAAHTGPIGAVTFTITGGLYAGTEGARLVSKQEINQDNLNPQGLTTIPPKYALEGDRLFHNAEGLIKGGATVVAVTVDICAFTATGTLQSPDEAADAVFHFAMCIIHKNGSHAQSAAEYRQWGQADLALLGVSPELAAKMAIGMDERAQGAQV